MKVRYTGTAGIRKISASDFKSVGVEDQLQVEVSGINYNGDRRIDSVVEVSASAGKYLLEKEQFEEVVEETNAPADNSEAEKAKAEAEAKAKAKAQQKSN